MNCLIGKFQGTSLAVLLAGLAACSAAPTDDLASRGADGRVGSADEDLTSLTARLRTLKLQGVVFVAADASDQEILYAARRQTRSGLGALRTADVGVNTRELRAIDPATFVKTKVSVVDVAHRGAAAVPMMRVQYTYKDDAAVPRSMARRSALGLALLNGRYESQGERVLRECTANDSEAREFASELWYVFDPSRSSCRAAITTEQRAIDADRRALQGAAGQVPASEVNRLYLPITVSLSGDRTNDGASYPEYDRLYAGGVKPGRLVIGMLNGMMADWAAGEHHDTIDDVGYGMWLRGLREIFAARTFTLAASDPAEDLSTLTANGKTATGVTFADVMRWELDGDGFPAAFTTDADRRALRVAAADKLAKRWLTFEAPVTVSIGGAPAQPFTIELDTYFGAEGDDAPHKRAIKNSDVFVYNGHSYIGYGPLDPSNFAASDFPASYQILFVNGCVSYNYYEKDYFPLKAGGTKNLDLITNGLESWVNGSGESMGRFVAALIDGKQESYTSLLRAAQFTDFGYPWGMDALRVVDGETDNVYSPAKTPIRVQ